MNRYNKLLLLLVMVVSVNSVAQNIVKPFYIRGTGLNHNTARVLKIDNQTIYSMSGRGLTLTILNKLDFSVLSSVTYDTYGSGTKSTELANSLNALNNSQIGILTSFDAWESNVNTALESAFLRLGLIKAMATENSGSRRPYAAIFEGASAGENSGKAIEVSFENTGNQPHAEIRGFLIEDSFVATGSQPNGLLRPQGDKAELIVDYNGNIGIGTTNTSGYKLAINGVAWADEIKVSNVPASDYVFDSDYNLLSLQEVESFIQQNKHLPDIPSAEEFKENGVGLGEMDDMLLRKVEELTLYIIALEKKLAQQGEEIEALQKKQ